MAVILVTGASSGFGKATALAFARRGDCVYASMRRPQAQPWAEAANMDIRSLQLDVNDKTSINTALQQIIDESGRIDVLVNNAGVHIPGAVEDMPAGDIMQVMHTNFFAVLDLTRAVLPQMRKQSSGRIIMVSSVGARIGRVNDGIYCASKSALEAASEALRYEVARFGIQVSVIEPGVFQTAIGDKYNVSENYPQDSAYRALIDFRINKVKASCRSGDDPLHVAEKIVAITTETQAAFRYPAGAQAEAFVPQLEAMDENQRERFIREAAQIDWWIKGEAAAPES